MNGKKTKTPIIHFLVSILTLILLLNVIFIQSAAASELVIIYSNDIRGETEPCG